jgi:hypothetical protein
MDRADDRLPIPEPGPTPLITRHDVAFLFDLAVRLHALGLPESSLALRELATRVKAASTALMRGEEASHA